VERLGGEGWNKLLKESGLSSKIYLPNQVYSDAELAKLVQTASQITGKPEDAIQQDFGEYVAPELVNLYRAQINPQWKTMDLILHTEEMVHRVVRLKVPGAKPPALKVEREGPKKVLLVYDSNRRMCGVAKGIIRGVARHYGEQATISEDSCMLQGGPRCQIHVEVA
jgi:hypothetical protein